MSFNAQGEWVDDGAEYIHVREWCITCDPEGVPEPWTPKLCGLHILATEGVYDRVVDTTLFLSGSAEAGGEGNAQFCRLLHPA